MSLPKDVDVATALPEELRRLVAERLGEVARLRAENAALRKEIARLEGHKGPAQDQALGDGAGELGASNARQDQALEARHDRR